MYRLVPNCNVTTHVIRHLNKNVFLIINFIFQYLSIIYYLNLAFYIIIKSRISRDLFGQNLSCEQLENLIIFSNILFRSYFIFNFNLYIYSLILLCEIIKFSCDEYTIFVSNKALAQTMAYEIGRVIVYNQMDIIVFAFILLT